MRNRKSIFVLLVLTVLLAAANAVLRYGTRETRASGRQVLVETADGICRIRLERKGSPDVELGKVGTRWRIITPYSGSAEDQVVMKTIDKLSMTPISGRKLPWGTVSTPRSTDWTPCSSSPWGSWRHWMRTPDVSAAGRSLRSTRTPCRRSASSAAGSLQWSSFAASQVGW